MSSFTIPFDVYIDYSLLGKNGTILSCPVSYGMHETVLKFTEKDAVQGIVLNENKKEVTLEVEQKMGLIAPKPNIKYK